MVGHTRSGILFVQHDLGAEGKHLVLSHACAWSYQQT